MALMTFITGHAYTFRRRFTREEAAEYLKKSQVAAEQAQKEVEKV